MISLRFGFVGILLALFCIFLMQESVESGLVKRDLRNELSDVEKVLQEATKRFEEANKNMESIFQKIQEIDSKIKDDEVSESNAGEVTMSPKEIAEWTKKMSSIFMNEFNNSISPANDKLKEMGINVTWEPPKFE